MDTIYTLRDKNAPSVHNIVYDHNTAAYWQCSAETELSGVVIPGTPGSMIAQIGLFLERSTLERTDRLKVDMLRHITSNHDQDLFRNLFHRLNQQHTVQEHYDIKNAAASFLMDAISDEFFFSLTTFHRQVAAKNLLHVIRTITSRHAIESVSTHLAYEHYTYLRPILHSQSHFTPFEINRNTVQSWTTYDGNYAALQPKTISSMLIANSVHTIPTCVFEYLGLPLTPLSTYLSVPDATSKIKVFLHKILVMEDVDREYPATLLVSDNRK